MAKFNQTSKRGRDGIQPASLIKCVKDGNQIYRKKMKTRLIHKISSIFTAKCISQKDKRIKKHQFHGGRLGRYLASCCPGRLGRLLKKVSIEEVMRASSTSSESDSDGRWESLCKEANARYIDYLMDRCMKKYHNIISPCGDLVYQPSVPTFPPAQPCAPDAPCSSCFPEYGFIEEVMPSFESSVDSLPPVMYILELQSSDENCNNLSPDNSSSFWYYSDFPQ